MSNSSAEADLDEFEEACCPLCVLPLDETDARFFPCPCRYQVCLFCVELLRNEHGGRCPACRQLYDESKFTLEESIFGTININYLETIFFRILSLNNL